MNKNFDYLFGGIGSFTNYEFEVLVVDDGSSEIEKIKLLISRYRCRLISLPKNLGKGHALRVGFEQAIGDYILFTDADIPFELSAIETMLNILNQTDSKVVIGNRLLPSSIYYKNVSIVRSVLSKIYSAFVTCLFGKRIDAQCGLKGFEAVLGKRIFAVSKVNRFAIDTEVLLICNLLKEPVRSINVIIRPNDRSTLKLFKDGFRLLYDVIQILLRIAFKRYDI